MSLEQLLEKIPRGSPDEDLAREINFDALPSHIAIIMDGNGRWAAQRHLPRVEGHRAGIEAVRDAVETSARLGIGALTLYAFSVENWKRPVTEVTALMTLLKRYLRLELDSAEPQQYPFSGDRPHRRAVGGRTRGARRRAGSDLAQHRHAVQHRVELRRPCGNRRCGSPRDSGRRAARRARRAEVFRVPLHRGAARSGSARSARAARCASAIFCCGKLRMPRSG